MRTGDRIHRAKNLAELVRPTGVMQQSIYRQRRLRRRCRPERCSRFGGEASCRAVRPRYFVLQFAAAHLEHFGHAIQNLSAQISALLRRIGECNPRRQDRVTEIFLRCATEVRQQSAAFSASRQDPAILTTNEFSADEEFVGLLDLKPRRLSLHEGEDCVNGEKRKC